MATPQLGIIPVQDLPIMPSATQSYLVAADPSRDKVGLVYNPDIVAAANILGYQINKVLTKAQADAVIALAQLGYLTPVEYSAGLSVSTSRFTVSYNGNTYAAKADSVPFTTSDSFDSSQWRLLEGVMAQDLASASGSSMIGYTRSLITGRSETVSDALDAKPLNLIEYESYADKSAGSIPEDWDWQPAIEAALYDIANFYTGYTLVFPAIKMTCKGSDGITVDLSKGSIDFSGASLYFPNLEAGNAAITITRTQPESSESQFRLGRFSIDNMVLIGPSFPSQSVPESNYTVGLRFVSTIDGTSVRFSLYNSVITNFGVGEQFLSRAYLIHHYKMTISNCGICISMPEGQADYGENIAYFGGVFSGGKFVDVFNYLSDFFFYACSFDYPKYSTLNYMFRFNGIANFYGCHLEFANQFNPINADHIFHLGNSGAHVLWDGGWISCDLSYTVMQYFVAQVDYSSFTMVNAYVLGIVPQIHMSNRPYYYKQRDIKLYPVNPGISYKGSRNFFETITVAGGVSPAGVYVYDGAATPRIAASVSGSNLVLTLNTISDAVGRGVRILYQIPRGAVGMDVEFDSISRAATAGNSIISVTGSFVMLNKSLPMSSTALISRSTQVFSLAARNLNSGAISRTLPNSPRAQPTGMNIPDYAEYLMIDISCYGASEPSLGSPAPITLSGFKVHSY